MNIKTKSILLTLLSVSLFAEPNIEGTPSNLESYLKGIPKTVSLSTIATKDVAVTEATVEIKVKSDSKFLAQAFKSNLTTRTNIKNKLKNIGIDLKNIKESKFSSAPEYSVFSKKPTSYKVENTLLIIVSSETQLIEIASIIDANKKVYFVSSKAKSSDAKKIEQELDKKNLATLKDKASVYEKQLKVKLVPVSFVESEFNSPTQKPMLRQQYSKTSSYGSGSNEIITSFGESKYAKSLTVTYKLLSK